MEAKYAPVYRSVWQTRRYLGDEAALLLYDAIMRFCFDDEYPDFNGAPQQELLEVAFLNLAPCMENTMKAVSKGSKGGRPRKEKPAEEPS